jgi:hypothetical protein
MDYNFESILENSIKSFLNNESFLRFKEFNNSLEKNNSNIEKIKEFYKNIDEFIKNINEEFYKIKKLTNIIEKRYPLKKNDKKYHFFKILTNKKYITLIEINLKKESEYYLKNDVINWRNILYERNKIMANLLSIINDFEFNEKKLENLTINSKIINNIYFLTDKTILNLFPRVSKYREYGKLSTQFCISKFNKILSKATTKERNYILSFIHKTDVWAYMDVTAQIHLIDYDIINGDITNQLPNILNASFKTGIDFLFIKIADDFQDKNLIPKNKLNLFFDEFEKAMLNEELIETNELPNICNSFISFVKKSQQNFPISNNRKKIIRFLKKANYKSMFSLPFHRKVLYSKMVGKLCADLTLDNFKIYLTNIKPIFSNFIKNKGITGNLFDDLKDYNLDIVEGHGYPSNKKFYLFLEMLKNFSNTFFKINLNSKVKLMNFCVLAGLFQIREFVNLKGKT